MAHGQTSWTGGAGPGDFTNGANWNKGAPLNQAAVVDTTSGTVSIFLTAPSPNPYTINGLAVSGINALTFTQNSGVLTFASGALDFGTSNSIYNLTGTASTLQVGGTNGITGTGTLNLAGGILQVINSNLTIGANVNTTLADGIYSIINTNGLNATFGGSVVGATGGLFKTGTGTLVLNASGNNIGSFLVTGGTVAQSTGTITTTELAVGTGAGTSANYNMTGGTLVFPTGTPPAIVGGVASSFRVGDFGGTGTFTQSNGSVIVGGGMDIGNEGGIGTYNISGGTLDLAGAGILNDLGRTTSSATTAGTGILNISGTAVVTLDSGKLIIGDRDNTGLQGTGILTQTGGTLAIQSGAGLYLSAYGNGSYNLTGGTLQIGGSSLNGHYNGSASYQFNFGGGMIQVIGSNLTTDVDMNLTANVYSIIDTNGLGATLTGTINGATGGLFKMGAGNLALNGSHNTIGSFLIAGGGVTQGTGTLTTAEMAVGTGTVTGTPGGLGNTGTYTMTGGALTFPGGTAPAIAGGGTSSSFRVGDYGGTGTFIQQAGAITLGGTGAAASLTIGNQGGTGTYNLQGGTLILADGYIDLGRSTVSSWGVSSGTLNMSGGTIEIQNGAYLALGGNISPATANQGTGVLTQTSGTIVIDAGGSFYLSAYGTGTYNFNGGVLEVGGNDLQARFGAGAPTTNFNLGGGTIQVTGSDLSVAADATLVGTSTSTINTGSLNATWTGSITGSGNLAKTGTGSLTLAKINTTGVLELQNGTTISSGSANVVDQLAVDAGNTTFLQVSSGGTLTLSTLARVYQNSTLNISGGGNLTSVGTFTVGDASTSGTLNLKSGTANFQSGVVVGNTVGSVGTVNQTGGIVNLTGGSLDLKQSTSIYNLSGGQFAMGGNGVKGAGQLNVNGGTLSGNGVVTAATVVSSNGIISPGSTAAGIHTPGQISFSNLSLNSASIYAWNLANESVTGPGLNFDQIQASAGGNILLNGALTLNLSFGSGINFADSFWTTSETWTVIDATAAGASLTGTASYSINDPGATGGIFTVLQVGNQVDLTWTPVPEPSTWMMLGMGFVLLLFLARKRRV